jgi:D-3-phosphoglycerate dehydrogenase
MPVSLGSAHDRVKILLVENVHPSATELLRGAGFEVLHLPHSPKEAEIEKLLQGVHALGIRSKTHVSAKALAAASDLLVVGCFCIGTNQVALSDAHRRGIPVFNAPFSNTRSVAELILAEIVALARQLGDRSREVHEGKWRKVSASCYEIRGKTLGIVGYGHIGTQVGVLAEAFGMRTVYFDIATKLPIGNIRSAASLAELLGASDFVTFHVPLTPQTENMIGETELSQMKPGSFLLNASRGSVVQIGPLAAAIRSKHIGGAAIDVYPHEPEGNVDDFASELRGLPNVILTPHIGGSTEEAQAAIGREVGTSLLKFLRAGTSTGAVNFPQVELPQPPATHRILNAHRNVPGVLRDINRIVSDHSANIRAQVLSTDSEVGYLIMDVDDVVSPEVPRQISELSTSIRTRVLRE